MTDLIVSKDFNGRFIISYKDEEIVYAYDEITHGLYKFSFDLKKVNMILSPKNIYHNSSDKVAGISKRGDEIILIPSFLNFRWIFYDIKKEKVRFESLVKNKIHISSVITIGENLFFIPNDIHNPIFIFSLKNMKIIKKYENWYKKSENKTIDKGQIWGASVDGDFIVFPIVGSNQIGCIDVNGVHMITLDISYQIFSVGIYKEKIWILPISGEYIYTVNLKGEIIDKINLCQDGVEISANKFFRIVATEEAAFLLPVYGENICVYQCKKKRIVQIETKKHTLWRNLFVGSIVPYWDFVIKNEILYLLPHDYWYREINMFSLESEEYNLTFENSECYKEYCELVRYVHKDAIVEKRKNDLKNFLQYMLFPGEKYLTKEDKQIGRKIWEMW